MTGNYYKVPSWAMIQVNILVVMNIIHYLIGIDASGGTGSHPAGRNCSAILIQKLLINDWTSFKPADTHIL